MGGEVDLEHEEQGGQDERTDPDPAVGAALIVGGLLLDVAGLAVLFDLGEEVAPVLRDRVLDVAEVVDHAADLDVAGALVGLVDVLAHELGAELLDRGREVLDGPLELRGFRQGGTPFGGGIWIGPGPLLRCVAVLGTLAVVTVQTGSVHHSGELVYDADCGFCSRFAAWSDAAVPWQDLDLEGVGVTVDQVTAAAGWLEDGQVVAWGSQAIAASLVQRGGLAGVAGRVVRLPVVRVAADLVYRWVARNRHLMPGGTEACRTAPPGPSRPLMLLVMSVILLTGLASLAAANRGHEPYPALIMPGFNAVPEAGGEVTSSEVVYTLVRFDGSSREVSAEQLLGEHSGYVAALRTLSAPGAAADPSTGRWLRANLGATADGAVALRADWHRISYDTATRERHDLGVVRTVTIDLEAAR